jgi:hypothetical protein
MMTRITTAIIAGLLLTTATVAQPLPQGQWKGGIELFDGTFTPGVSADRCLGNPGNPCPATYSLEMRNLNSEHLDVMVLCLAHDQNKKPFASATWTFIAVAPRETQQGLIVFHDVRGPADAAGVAGVICEAQLWAAVPSRHVDPKFDDRYGLRGIIDKRGEQCPPGYGEVEPAPGVPGNRLIGPGYCGPLPGTKHKAIRKPSIGCPGGLFSGEYCLLPGR